MKSFSKLFISFFLWVSSTITFAKVVAPNYNFTLDKLQLFQPGSTTQGIEAKFGKGEVLDEVNGIQLLRYSLKANKYSFPVFVQTYRGISLDFFAKLPNYFLHDIFHRSLILRYGKQSQYFNKENSSVYIWNNKDGIQHVYSGSCTLQCFPVYYSAITLQLPNDIKGFKSLLDRFGDSAPYKKKKFK